MLKEKYGFRTKLLIDATRDDILDGLNELRESLGSRENILIYYAGHGEYDKTVDKAYWLPVDARKDRTTNWIIADDITSNIKRVASKHILLVSDSCYSGTLSRAATAELGSKAEHDEYIRKMLERPSRTLMASGGNEPVADGGGGNNSVFAAALIKALGESDKSQFTADELFHGRVRAIVAGKSDQVPEYHDIKNSGHEGGDFVFQLAKAITTETKVPVSMSDVQLNAPTESGFTMDDLEKKGQQVEANKAAWGEKLKEMQKAYNQVQAYEKKSGTPDLKVAAWERFAGAFAEDNPYSTDDDDMRAAVQDRIAHWQGKQRDSEEKKIAMAPRPSKTSTGGSTYTDPTTGMEFVRVKGGCYQMGDTFGDGDEKPVHEVCVDDFYIGKYTVTQGQWQAVMGNNPSYFKNGDNYPVEQVSWNDAQDFINRLNEKVTPLNPPLSKGGGKGGYRLPTEAEWEYAAREGGRRVRFGTGTDTISSDIANFDASASYKKPYSEVGQYRQKTTPVGSFRPNSLGLYDMAGNVWQWTADWYGENYSSESPKSNPTGPNSGQYRVLRGGPWSNWPSARSRGSPGQE
jgi:formylglycine-generating enzyme required for sulfatase activity